MAWRGWKRSNDANRCLYLRRKFRIAGLRFQSDSRRNEILRREFWHLQNRQPRLLSSHFGRLRDFSSQLVSNGIPILPFYLRHKRRRLFRSFIPRRKREDSLSLERLLSDASPPYSTTHPMPECARNPLPLNIAEWRETLDFRI